MKNLITKNKKALEKIFKKEGVILAYLFGSAAREKTGPLSDIDIAVLFSSKIKKGSYFDKRLRLASEIDRVLGIYKTEVICLNQAPPLLKHQIVCRGVPIYVSDSTLKRIFELRVLQEFEDFNYHLKTSFKAMEKRIKEGTFGKPLNLTF